MAHPVVELSQASIEKRDLDVLVRYWQAIKPKIIVEIGTWKGYSAHVWIELFRPDLFITVDKDKQFPDAFIRDDDRYHYLYETDSTTAETKEKITNLLDGKAIDFLFIDGGHNYNTVRKDWELYSPLVKEGGIVAFHDVCYTHYECQVPALWRQLKSSYPYVESNASEGSTGLGFLFNEPNRPTVAQKTQTL